MSRIGVAKVILYTHAHATEDVDKVKQAMLNLLPHNLRSKAHIEQEALEGFYGNIINKLKIVLEGVDAMDFLRNFFNILSKTDKNMILNTLSIRYNRKNNEMVIKLSKQDAYLGVVTLFEGDDAIKITITFSYERSIDAVRKFLESMMEGSINVG